MLKIDKIKPVKWLGVWPAKCDSCGCDLSKRNWFVDGVRKGMGGAWGLFCISCYDGSYGTGRGQLYNAKT